MKEELPIPDPAQPGGETPPPGGDANKPAKKTKIIPQKDIDLGNVAETVSEKWLLTPELTLIWITALLFKEIVISYNETLSQRQSIGGGRKIVTDSLKDLDKEIDTNTEYVKGYLKDKYEENAPSYFPSFGIVKRGNAFKLPYDQNSRLKKLDLMKAGIIDNGFGDKTYGTDYWDGIKTAYKEALKNAKSIDGGVSVKVGSKNELKNKIKEVLNSLIHLIKANYRKNADAKLRDFGFQKEKY